MRGARSRMVGRVARRLKTSNRSGYLSGVRAALILVLLWSFLPACSTTDTVKQCPFGYCNAIRDCCAGPQETNTTTGADDTGTTDGGGTDGDDIPDVSQPEDDGPVAAEDAGMAAQDVKKDGQCHFSDPQNLRIGMPCSDHAQCETCYCYDGAYLSPFRFCTQDCSSGPGTSCSDWDNPNAENPEYACVRFTQSLINTYDLAVEAVCMPRCGSAAECQLYAPDYNHCGASWDGQTIQGIGTCQTSEQ